MALRVWAEGEVDVMVNRGRSRAFGQGMVEYALIIALVVMVVLAALILFGPQLASIFKNINNNL